MNYSKVMQRVFSNSAKDKSFQKCFSDALDVAENEGSAKVVGDGEDSDVDLEINKNEDGTFTVNDNVNDEVTKATVNGNDVELEKVESESEPEPEPEPDQEQNSDPEPADPENEETSEQVTVKEVKPEEEYEITSKQGTFSVKGSLTKAISFAKKFSENSKVVMDLTDVGDNMNPEKNFVATTGVIDQEKAGNPSNRQFSEPKLEDQIEEAKKHAMDNEEGAIVEKDGRAVLIQNKEGKFSFYRVDTINRVFSEIPEQDIVGTLDGTIAEPEKKNDADLGVKDPEKAGDPENRQFGENGEGEGEKPEEVKTLDEQIDSLGNLAEKVDEDPTKEDVESLEKGINEVSDKVECDKTYSSLKKEITLGKLKIYSEVLAQAKSKIFSAGEAEISEEQNRSFSSLFTTESKTFATKEELEAASKAFSESGQSDNPCLTTEF